MPASWKPAGATLVAVVVVFVLATAASRRQTTVTFLHLNDVYEISPSRGAAGSRR